MVVLNKPSGLQVLPAAMQHERTVLTLLRTLWPPPATAAPDAGAPAPHQQEGDEAAVLPPPPTPAPVHRLGRGTSGLLLCGVSEAGKRALTAAMTHTTLLHAAPPPAPPQQQQQRGDATVSPATAGEPLPPAWPEGLSTTPGAHVLAVAPSRPPPSEPQTHGGAAASAGEEAEEAGGGAWARAVPPGAVRKLYRARLQGLLGRVGQRGVVRVPIGRVERPGVRGGLWAAAWDADIAAAPSAGALVEGGEAGANGAGAAERAAALGGRGAAVGAGTAQGRPPGPLPPAQGARPALSAWRVAHQDPGDGGARPPSTLVDVSG